MSDLVNSDRIDGIVTKIENIFSVCANIGMMVMMFLIATNTFLRYVFNSPISGMVPIVELYLMPLVVFGTVALLQRNKGNINVDLLKRKFSPFNKEIVNLIGQVGAVWFFGSMSYLTFKQATTRISNEATLTGVLELPTGYSWLIIALGLGLYSIRLIIQVVGTVITLAEHVRSDTSRQSEESA